MADNKNNIYEPVDDYCQITDQPSSDTPTEVLPTFLAADSGRSRVFATNQNLANQLSRCDEYADQLRWQICDLQATVSTLSEQLSEAKDNAEKKGTLLKKVKALLASARRTNSDLRERNELAEKRHNVGILALQVQLENADSSTDDTDVQNQELAVELMKVRQSRELLRSEMQAHDKKAARRINAVKAKYKKLARQIKEYKEQIAAKNQVIHALLNHMAPKSSPNKNDPDTDDTVQVIDYSLYGPLCDESDASRSMEQEDRSNTEDDRCSRELVGRIDGARMCFSITKDKLTIGRTIENDIQLTPWYISRHHATIVTEDGQTRVVDLGSKNGVFVNYKRVKEHALINGDVVAVGFAKFIYREQPQADA